MPARVSLAISGPGAPGEPQRTPVRVASSREEYLYPLKVAFERGLLAQEALEPTFALIEGHSAIPALIRGDLDAAIVDVATFLGERALGWDGLAIAAFGPLATDRSCGLLAVEAKTWTDRRDAGERLVRAASRAMTWLQEAGDVSEAQLDAGVPRWWRDCRPSASELTELVRWEPGPLVPALSEGLAWEADPSS